MYVASILAAGMFFSGCRQAPAPIRPNIVLISIDTLRADHLGCYGYGRPTSPNLDVLAARGTIFLNIVADSPWTLPSHASLFTGLRPRYHGVRSHETALPRSIDTLATLLEKEGYATMGIVNNKHLLPRYGLDRGFQRHVYFPERKERRRVRSAQDQVALAETWISEEHEGPFFLFLHTYDVHSGYNPPPESAEILVREYSGPLSGSTGDLMRIRRGDHLPSSADETYLEDLYDACIRGVDEALSKLFATIDQKAGPRPTTIIVTSDHGEEFFEHGGVLHGRTMFSEVVRVPLIVAGPGIPQGERNSRLGQLSDVFTTVLSMAGVRCDTRRDGQDLFGPRNGRGDPDLKRYVFAEADHNREEGDDTLEMVRTSAYKMIFNLASGRVRLFDLREDPGEQVDVSGGRSEVVEDLREQLERGRDQQVQGEAIGILTDKERRDLQSLGYLQ